MPRALISVALLAALVHAGARPARAQEPAVTPEPAPETAGPEPLDVGGAEAALDLDGGESASPPRLDLYGFADFIYYRPFGSKSNPWLQYFPRNSSFILGHLNFYASAALSPRLRSMVEVRFHYAPQATTTVASDGTQTRQRGEALDPAEFGRTVRWGGIQIERAWVEYDLHPLLTARLGQWHTPYGIWNVDHGAPTLIGIQRPWTIREQLFPEWQTGVQLHGRRTWGRVTGGYHLTLSNGRGPFDSFLDQDESKAVGGRLLLEARGEGSTLTVGASAYRGLYTERAESWSAIGGGMSRLDSRVAIQYDEVSLAGDLRFEAQSLVLHSEIVLNDRAYREPGRPRARDLPDRFAPDLRRWGVYGLAGYRTPWYGVMPYANVELFNMGVGAYPSAAGYHPRALTYFLGVNARVRPDLVLKLEVYRSTYPGARAGSWGAEHGYDGLQAQVAWVF